MSGQPKVENLVKGFVWAQLDQVNKRLYYVYPTVESTNNVSKSMGCMSYLFFSHNRIRVSISAQTQS